MQIGNIYDNQLKYRNQQKKMDEQDVQEIYMEIRKLDALCKVIELKSFTRAAEAMLLSQPTISEHIRSLEVELGQQLIERHGREIDPTPAGQLLHRYARKILQTRSEAIQAVQQYSGTVSGRIIIGSGTIPGTYVLPELIGSFRSLYPSIKATLRITGSQRIAAKVLAGEYEIGVVGAKWNEKGLEWTPVFSDELTVAVHPSHPWSKKKHVALQDICEQPFIMREPGSGTRKVFTTILKESGIHENSLQEVAEIGSTDAVKEAVKSGLGVAVLSKYAVRDDVQCGRLATVALDGHDLWRSFYLIRRKNRTLTPVASLFFEYLLENGRKTISDPPHI